MPQPIYNNAKITTKPTMWWVVSGKVTMMDLIPLFTTPGEILLIKHQFLKKNAKIITKFTNFATTYYMTSYE